MRSKRTIFDFLRIFFILPIRNDAPCLPLKNGKGCKIACAAATDLHQGVFEVCLENVWGILGKSPIFVFLGRLRSHFRAKVVRPD
jgi:hypothetical protein